MEQRIKVMRRSDGGQTAISISKSLKVGKTQICTRNYSTKGGNSKKLREWWECRRKYSKQRKFINGDSNENLLKWFCDCRRRNIPLCGRTIQEKAAIESTVFGHN